MANLYSTRIMMPRSLLKNIRLVFLAMFFFSLYVATTGYVNSSLMESFGWTHITISSIYAIASFLTILALMRIQHLIQNIGNRWTLITFLSLLMLAILGVLLLSVPWIQMSLFVLLLILNSLIIFNMDVVLEYFSLDEFTGRIRGLFLVMINFTWALAILPAGYLIDTYGIKTIYFISMVSILISCLIFIVKFKKIAFKNKALRPLKDSFQSFFKSKDRKNIFSLSFCLHLFYAIAIIYMPIHLHNVIGFDWVEIGGLLLIANIPFLLLEYPVGRIADKYVGEQELMITGFILSGIACIGFATFTTDSFLWWAALLFFSRVGISVVETTTESYFFKITNNDDVEAISIQRKAIPLGYLIAPLIGIVASFFTSSYTLIFFILAIILFLALYPAMRITDTK